MEKHVINQGGNVITLIIKCMTAMPQKDQSDPLYITDYGYSHFCNNLYICMM